MKAQAGTPNPIVQISGADQLYNSEMGADKILIVFNSLLNLVKAETGASSNSCLLKKRKVMQDRLLTGGYKSRDGVTGDT